MSITSSAGRRRAVVAGILTAAAITGCVVLAQSNVGQIQDIYNFTGGADGAIPVGPLLQSPNGEFVGETSGYGKGTNIPGTVFQVNGKGSLQTLFTFAADGSQGKGVFFGLFQASDGNFYGTSAGGPDNEGLGFRVTPSGQYTSLGSLSGNLCGRYIQAFDGNLYKPSLGGAYEGGCITRTSLAGRATVIYSFGKDLLGGTSLEGSIDSPLVMDSSGFLYGETDYYYYPNGTLVDGSVFRTDTNGNLTTIYIFDGPTITKGDVPPVLGSDGDLYFASPTGGALNACTASAGCGSIYKIAADGSGATLLYSFTGGSDGGTPQSLMQGSDGNFYGTSRLTSPGAVFQFNPATRSIVSYPFPAGLPAPSLPPLQALGGNFLGVTAGGSDKYGAVFTLSLGLPPAKPSILGFRPLNGGPGTLVTIWGSNFIQVGGVTVAGVSAKFRNTASGFASFAVPQGASSGPVTVTTPGGTATSAGAFSMN